MALFDAGDRELAAFARRNMERMSKAFLAKLEQLPLVEGQPDFSGIVDPAEIAKQWAEEIKPPEEDLLEQLIQDLNEALAKGKE